MKGIAGALAAVVLIPTVVVVLVAGQANANDCAPLVRAPEGATVAGYQGDQLSNAASIMNTATRLNLDRQAQIIGVMTAMGESSLHNIDHGDGVLNPDGTPESSLGLFQQQKWKGTAQQRLTPEIAAAIFYQDLFAVPEWKTLPPSEAAHRAQVNSDAGHYVPYIAPATAVVDALNAARASQVCALSGDARQLAAQLVSARAEGRLTVLEPRYWQQVQDVADGKSSADCGLSVGVLQIIVVALKNFDSVGISDLNRKCTGSLLGAGTGSSHWINGGGQALDFYQLNGRALTGADPLSLQLIKLLDPLVPPESRIGQSDVRAAAGASVHTTNFTQFPDSGDHLHIDIAYAEIKVLKAS